MMVSADQDLFMIIFLGSCVLQCTVYYQLYYLEFAFSEKNPQLGWNLQKRDG